LPRADDDRGFALLRNKSRCDKPPARCRQADDSAAAKMTCEHRKKLSYRHLKNGKIQEWVLPFLINRSLGMKNKQHIIVFDIPSGIAKYFSTHILFLTEQLCNKTGT